MKQKDFGLGLACKNSKEFMDMFAVYVIHHLGINRNDIRVIWNPQTHTTFLELKVHYVREGRLNKLPFGGLFPDHHVNGTMRLTLDNGWDWVLINLDDLSEKDVMEQLLCLKAFVEEIKETYPNMFGEYNPSERD